jgi:hypothetical protein
LDYSSIDQCIGLEFVLGMGNILLGTVLAGLIDFQVILPAILQN